MTMALTAPTIIPRYGQPPGRVRQFTVPEYHRLIDQGFFRADERFELLEGWIVEKMSRNPPHDSALNRIRRRLEKELPNGWMIRIQSAITTADSEPEPDIAIVRGDDADYQARHPSPANVALIVEVSNTTLADDRSLKLRVYARAGVPQYWIANLNDRTVEAFSDPLETDYAQRSVWALDDTAELVIAGASVAAIPVKDLLL